MGGRAATGAVCIEDSSLQEYRPRALPTALRPQLQHAHRPAIRQARGRRYRQRWTAASRLPEEATDADRRRPDKRQAEHGRGRYTPTTAVPSGEEDLPTRRQVCPREEGICQYLHHQQYPSISWKEHHKSTQRKREEEREKQYLLPPFSASSVFPSIPQEREEERYPFYTAENISLPCFIFCLCLYSVFIWLDRQYLAVSLSLLLPRPSQASTPRSGYSPPP